MTDRDEQNLNPQQGCVEMHNGSTLFWQENKAGGRTYSSDEIGGGVEVWDTCLVAFGTLCEAISMEMALQGVERRAAERARPKTTAERFAALTGADGPGGSTSQAPSVRSVDDGPCPNCGALGCWTPCPYEPPATSLGRLRTPEAAAKRRKLLERVSRSDMGPNVDDEAIPEGVAVFDGDTLPEALRTLTHEDVAMRVALRRARKQLLRYSSEDPIAAEIAKLLAAGAI